MNQRLVFIFSAFIGIFALVNVSMAQSSIVTYPQNGDTLVASKAEIYFNALASPYEQYRITLGATSTGRGLHDSGARPAGDSVYVIPMAAVPTNGSPVYMKFWQRPLGGSWDTFVLRYQTESLDPVVAVPPRPVTLDPKSEITQTKPTYRWNSIANVSLYQLRVFDSATNSRLINTRPKPANVCSGSRCEYTASLALSNGKSYKWQVRAQNSRGWGSWSSKVLFNVKVQAGPSTVPAKPVQLQPFGGIAVIKPAYQWENIANATLFQIQVFNSSSNVRIINARGNPSNLCSGNTCQITPSTSLANGTSYNWRVRAKNVNGWGAWSSRRQFSVDTDVGTSVLSRANLTYKGAFKTPSNDAWDYGGYAMTHLPSGVGPFPDSRYGNLLISGTRPSSQAGVISIASPVIARSYEALPNVNVLVRDQAIITGSLAPIGETFLLGGFQYLQDKNKIMWSWRDFYNTADADSAGHGWVDPNLNNPQGNWHVGPYGDIHNNLTNDYMFLAPSSASFLGNKKLIVGSHRESGSNGGSQGPSLVATEPPARRGQANSSTLDAVKLLDHGPQSLDCLVDPARCKFASYRATDQWGGGAWIETARSAGVVIIGRKAIGTTCYGEPGNDAATRYDGGGAYYIPGCGTEVSDKNPANRRQTCGSPDQGFHSGPHVPMMLFYSANDLKKVAQGSKRASTVKTTSRSTFNGLDPDGCGRFGSVAYDPNEQRIYVTETMGELLGSSSGKVVVHVWEVN